MQSENSNNLLAVIANKNFDSLSELFDQVDASTVQGIVTSITYDVRSQKVIIQLKNLLERETDIAFPEESDFFERSDPQVSGTDECLKRLSDKYGDTYPQLEEHFNTWETSRKTLMEKSKYNADMLDLNFKCASFCRFLGSSLEFIGIIGGTILKYMGSDWAEYVLSASTSFGQLSLVSTLSEATLSKCILDEMQMYIKEDQKTFQPIEQWFKQTKELDDAVKELFPYGIDNDIIKEIEEASNIEGENLKIFYAALATNVKKHPELFKNKNFLTRLFLFSKNKVAVEWWKRVIVAEYPIHIEGAKVFFESSFSQIENRFSNNISSLSLEAVRINLALQIRVLLSGLTVYTSLRCLKTEVKSKPSDLLRDLESKTDSEFKAIEDIVQKLKPE